MIGIGVIGYGYWGPHLVRNFADVPGARVVAVADVDSDRLALARQRHPAVETTRDAGRLFAHPAVDAVVVATPVSTHDALGRRALAAGKHLWLEKPLARSTAEAARLVEEAERRRLVLMVDHTYVYTGAVRAMRDLMATGALGEVYYYDAVRVNLGLFQPDVNVLWDLAVHDLAIVDHLFSWQPVAVSAVGTSHVPGVPENIAYLTLFFDRPLLAHIHANWLAPVKVRRTLIGGSRRMIAYDDLAPDDPVQVYDRGITVEPRPGPLGPPPRIGYRAGDAWAPPVDRTEALRTAALHFVDCIERQRPAITDGQAGLRVVRILEAAGRSLAASGRPIEVRAERPAARPRAVAEAVTA